jgi:hypothetical protein
MSHDDETIPSLQELLGDGWTKKDAKAYMRWLRAPGEVCLLVIQLDNLMDARSTADAAPGLDDAFPWTLDAAMEEGDPVEAALADGVMTAAELHRLIDAAERLLA